jgi:NlpC/P60 family putative phage cell wall peptidase
MFGAHCAPEPIRDQVSLPQGNLDSASPRLRVKNLKTAEEIVQIARAWIGTPYVHQASVKGAGCDCLGLLRGVWRELRGEEPEIAPPYSPDWAEATGEETLYSALKRHLLEIDPRAIAPGDVALFRMLPNGPAKHCGIVASRIASPLWGGRNLLFANFGWGTSPRADPPPGSLRSPTSPQGGGDGLTLIHARQNKRVSEEQFAPLWIKKVVYTFRLTVVPVSIGVTE